MKTLKRVGHWLLRPFIDNGVFFVSMYVLGVLCAVLTLPDTKGAKLYDNLWLELFLDTYVACVVLSLIPRKIRVWVRRLLYVVLYSVAITDVFCFWKFGTTINPSMLLLVGETDSREAGEFFSTYLNLDVLLSPIGWIVLLMLAHAVIALRKKLCRLFKINYSQLVKPFFIKVSALSGRYRLVPVSAVAVVVLLVWSVCSSWQNKKGMTRLMTADTIGEVEHPFTTNFSKDDVRITTHYHEKAFASSMYSVIHEGGHALYELNIGDDIKYSPLGGGASMSIHESQSRFYENIIGRSEAFLTYILPDIQKLGPKALKDVTPHDFYLAVNKSKPSLIRTQADELTYCFHVMIRYELEKQLIAGTLAVKDLPAAWNKLYKEYLGVDVPNDTQGVLQDSHWSGGAFGYFPSYALGSAYGAQMLKVMERDIPVWELVAKGDLKPIVGWLTERIYRYGRLLKPNELILKACEAPFDPRYYVDYLKNKYTEVYGL